MNKLLIITGPTATGKSALAIDIAKLYDGEIISADSRQVYTGLDIGSAKVTAGEMDGIPHHMIDIANPVSDVFTVADFQMLAREKILDIRSRGKLPILCGGTGMYIDAVVYDMQFPTVPADMELRDTLGQQPASELFAQLQILDPVRAENIDKHNKVRLIRAIEVANSRKSQGMLPCLGELSRNETEGYKIFNQYKNTTPSLVPRVTPLWQEGISELYTTLWIGLYLPKDTMIERISSRITDRIPVLFDEIKHLQSIGVTDQRLHGFGLEYRYGLMYVRGEINEAEFIELLTTKTWQFSKRQMTWFKRNNEINWFDPITDKQKILEQVKEFFF
jgi:tRNA dimethylallyltransferase